MDNLQQRSHYSLDGAREICTYVIDRDLAGKFSEI